MIVFQLTEDETRDFLWETWRFVKHIFPLLVVGVFAVGIIRELIRPEWIEALAGSNTLFGNFIGVVEIGVDVDIGDGVVVGVGVGGGSGMSEEDVMVALDVVQDAECQRLQAWAWAVLAAVGMVEVRPGLTEMMIVWSDRSGTHSGSYRVSVSRAETHTRSMMESSSSAASGKQRWSASSTGNRGHAYAISFSKAAWGRGLRYG